MILLDEVQSNRNSLFVGGCFVCDAAVVLCDSLSRLSYVLGRVEYLGVDSIILEVFPHTGKVCACCYGGEWFCAHGGRRDEG